MSQFWGCKEAKHLGYEDFRSKNMAMKVFVAKNLEYKSFRVISEKYSDQQVPRTKNDQLPVTILVMGILCIGAAAAILNLS